MKEGSLSPWLSDSNEANSADSLPKESLPLLAPIDIYQRPLSRLNRVRRVSHRALQSAFLLPLVVLAGHIAPSAQLSKDEKTQNHRDIETLRDRYLNHIENINRDINKIINKNIRTFGHGKGFAFLIGIPVRSKGWT